MKAITFKIIGIAVTLLILGGIVRAQQYSNPSLEAIDDLFSRLEIPGKLARNSPQYLNINDETFYNIDRKILSNLTGETFEDDLYRETELVEPWMTELGRSENWIYRIDDDKERVQLVNTQRALHENDPKKIKDKNAIEQIAKNDLKKIGLDPDVDATLDIQVNGVGRAWHDEKGKTENELIAHKVRVFRKFGNDHIDNAQILLSYHPDGTLNKLSMDWPHIDAQSIMFEFDDEKIKEIKDKTREALGSHPLGNHIDVLSLSTGYTIENGKIKKTIAFTRPYPYKGELQQSLIVSIQ